MFIDAVMAAAKAGEPFDAKAFDASIWEFENQWAQASHQIEYPQPGDPIEVAKELLEKYR